MVSLGKPKEKAYLYAPIEIDGLTMHKNTSLKDDLSVKVALTKFMFSKMLRLDPISKLPPLEAK